METKQGDIRRIPLENCHLFRILSPLALAIRLGISLPKLERIANNPKYRVFSLKDSSREIQEPGPDAQRLHRQIHRYLARVETPAYLHSTAKGRSYVTNAASHVGCGSMIKIDIKKFYPSVPQHKVMHFFRDVMQCSGDVAGLLAKLLCFNGRLPTGSSSSPIVSYYAYKPMFDDIAGLAEAQGLTVTVYVDDITLSGDGVNGALLHEVRRIILRYGLKAHKAKFAGPTSRKIVTGVVVGLERLELPFSRWKAMKAEAKAVREATSRCEKITILNRLVSRFYEATQIEPSLRRHAVRYHEQLKQLRAEAAQSRAGSSLAA